MERVLEEISAGSELLYQIVQTDDDYVEVRFMEDSTQRLRLIPSMLPTLASSLMMAYRKLGNDASS